jgi:HEAT repeat protein
MRAPLVLAIIVAAAASGSAWQSAIAPPKPEALSATETIILTNGWAALAEGKFDFARQKVAEAFAASPQSVNALTLAIEIDIAQKDSNAALATYETWLGRRTLDEPFTLRRIARAALFEASRLQGAPVGTRLNALRALAEEGEPAARTALENQAFRVPGSTGALPETQVLTSMGDPRAVSEAIKYLGAAVPGKANLMAALADSRSSQAIPPLIRMLKDPEPANVAAAAEALGRLDARGAMTQLRDVYSAQTSIFPVRMAAAGALYRMGDSTGQPQLRSWLTSGPAAVRVEAARAMASQPDPEWQAAVREVLTSDDPSVLIAGASLIAPYDLQLATETIGRLMNSSNVVVREKAAQVLAKQLATDFRVLRGLMRSGDTGTRAAAAARVLELTR